MNFLGFEMRFLYFFFIHREFRAEKSLRGKKGAHISEKNVEIERGMGFIEVSWILDWAFEFRKSSIEIEF